jgi:hypothetical protein
MGAIGQYWIFHYNHEVLGSNPGAQVIEYVVNIVLNTLGNLHLSKLSSQVSNLLGVDFFKSKTVSFAKYKDLLKLFLRNFLDTDTWHGNRGIFLSME